MKQLSDYKEEIHSCSKCGLCQSVCPIYKITGNDCTVSRGHFIMLKGLIKGDLKMSKTINRYLDLCLKCNACSKFCPSGIDIVDIVASAKAEYFKKSRLEKMKSNLLKLGLNSLNLLSASAKHKKSINSEKKVIYFGGCGSKFEGDFHIVKILNSMNIEVITPNFDCCGFPFFVQGDTENFKAFMDKFYSVLEQYGDYDIVTNCATCEKTLKSYAKFGGKEIRVKNIFEYILSGEKETQLLHIRVFDEKTKRIKYIQQTNEAKAEKKSNCPDCAIGHDANKTKIWALKDMDADHVLAWSKGGETTIENCQMLCKHHNRSKGNA